MSILVSTYSVSKLQEKFSASENLETCGWKAVYGVFKLSLYLPCCARGPLAMESGCYGETSFPTHLGASLTGLHTQPVDSEGSGRRTLSLQEH